MNKKSTYEELELRVKELEKEAVWRKQAEEATLESEEELKAIFDSVRDGIALLDMTGKVIKVNKRIVDVGGYSEEEIVERRIKLLKMFTPSSIAKMLLAFVKIISGQQVLPVEVETYTKNGEKLVVEIHGSLFKKRGKAMGMVAVMRDITERKRMEEALRESEEKYRTIIESIEDGYYEVDLAGNFTFVNDSECKILGYSKDELIGMNNRQYMDGESARKVYQVFNKVYKTEIASKLLDWLLIRKGGTKSFAEISVSLIKDSEGNPTGFRGILRDITERKQAMDALRASETEKKAILDAMSDVVLFQDTNLSIRWGNEAARQSVGKTHQKLVGCYCYELWHSRSEPCKGCPVLSALETGSPAKSIMTTPDGRWWEIIGEPIGDRDKKIVGAIEIARDITEQKRAEEALRESEEKYRSLVESTEDSIYLLDSAHP